MAMRFWTPLFQIFLACIFNQKWNPVNGNHNLNVTRTIFSLSVIKEPAIRSIWCSASFDRQLHIHFTRWRRYHYGIRPSFTTLSLLGGDIELNPGIAQKQERNENMYINQCEARKNRKHLMSVAYLNVCSVASRENFCLLKQTVTSNNFDIFTSLSSGWTVQYATRIFLFRDTTFRQDRGPHKRGGGVLVYVKDIYKACVIEKWSSVSESNFQQLWLLVQCKKFKSFLLFTVYRPPDAPIDFLENLSETFVDSATWLKRDNSWRS